MENLNNETTDLKEVTPVPTEVADEITDDQKIRLRLNEVYNQISLATDASEMTAIILTTTEYYGYGIRVSNNINDRTGKNRLTVTHGTYKLNEYSMEVNVNLYRQERIKDMVVLILNTYLSNKQVLPTNKPKKAAGIISRVKALYINLFFTNNYGLIGELNTPQFMNKYVHEAFKVLKELQDDSVDEFIEYLESIEEFEAANLVKENGDTVWGGEKTDTIDAFTSLFKNIKFNLKNRKAVENAYSKFRGQYIKSSYSIAFSNLYEIMDITRNAYDNARKNVFAEISELAAEDGQLKIINSILNER